MTLPTLNCKEQILFTGTYNINMSNQTSPSITSIITQIETNKCGYNLLVDNFYNTTDDLIPPNNFLLETITISSYTHDIQTKVGQIQFTSFYKNDSTSQDSPDTTENFIEYHVLNSSGIYIDVKKIILDAMNDQRILFFIAESCD